MRLSEEVPGKLNNWLNFKLLSYKIKLNFIIFVILNQGNEL